MQNDSVIPNQAAHSDEPLRSFVVRLVLFFLPLFLVVIAFEGYLWKSGESWPVQMVLNRQATNPDAIWMRGKLGQSYMAYKWSAIQSKTPQILAVGSSRVMKFNGKLLAPESGTFYNTGGMIRNLADLNSFVDAIPKEAAPKVMLLGIDMWWLNPSFPAAEGFKAGIYDDPAYDWKAHLTVARQAGAIVRAERASKRNKEMKDIAPANCIGLDAVLKHRGFRADGSLESGLVYTDGKFIDRESPPIVERVKTGGNRFEYADGISEERIALLHRALKTLREKGVLVLTFTPPVANEVVTAVEKEAGQKNVWREYRQMVPRICAEEKTIFCDASSPQRFGYSDSVMGDGIHAMETFHAVILREWLKNPEADRALPGTKARIQKLLAAPGTNAWYPDYNAVK